MALPTVRVEIGFTSPYVGNFFTIGDPARGKVGVNAIGVHYARYVADWASRIEKIGTERYPPEARGRQYDSLIITVEIDKHGNVVDVVINKKSKYEALNRAVKQIVYAGQPLTTSPPGILGATDTIVRRNGAANIPLPGSSATIPIELVALSLVSVSPITVTWALR